MPAPAEQPRVAIVGGGIAGLAAAFFLRDAGAAVTVLEGSPRLGGKLAVSEVAGIAVDAGAEALLARRPEGTGLAAAVGLAGQLVQPGTTAAGIWTRGRLRPLPQRQFMGVPADLDALADSGILSAPGLASARADAGLPATARAGDVSVASYVGARFGRELVDRLVDPLLGGVYAGRSDQLSFEATLPALAAESRRHASLAAAAGAVIDAGNRGPGQAAGGGGPGPVFTTPAGGLAQIPSASLAIVTLAYPDQAFPALPTGSGYLVPAVDGHPVKAVTFSTVKWPHLRPAGRPVHIVRCSVGRLGEEALLQRDDAELAALAAADLAAATGVRGAPLDTRVSRWGGSLPQYTVGHLDRVAGIRAALAAQPGIAACGASYAGIGIPACIASARAAADQVIAYLGALAAVGPGAVAARRGGQ